MRQKTVVKWTVIGKFTIKYINYSWLGAVAAAAAAGCYCWPQDARLMCSVWRFIEHRAHKFEQITFRIHFERG